MPLGHRSARRRGLIMGAAISSSRNAKRQAAAAAAQPASAATTPTVAPADDTVAQLTQLASLRDQGILTEEEFAAKKKQILGI